MGGRRCETGVLEDDNADPEVGAAVQAPALGRGVGAHHSGEVPVATLPGFRMFRDGTSRVFVEVSADVPVKETRAEGVLTYRLVGVQVPKRVNLMDLPTQYFPTPAWAASRRVVERVRIPGSACVSALESARRCPAPAQLSGSLHGHEDPTKVHGRERALLPPPGCRGPARRPQYAVELVPRALCSRR